MAVTENVQSETPRVNEKLNWIVLAIAVEFDSTSKFLLLILKITVFFVWSQSDMSLYVIVYFSVVFRWDVTY